MERIASSLEVFFLLFFLFFFFFFFFFLLPPSLYCSYLVVSLHGRAPVCSCARSCGVCPRFVFDRNELTECTKTRTNSTNATDTTNTTNTCSSALDNDRDNSATANSSSSSLKCEEPTFYYSAANGTDSATDCIEPVEMLTAICDVDDVYGKRTPYGFAETTAPGVDFNKIHRAMS